MTASRGFTVGETVHLDVRVATPGGSQPTDPERVRLVRLRRGEVDLLAEPVDLERVEKGDYTYAIQTVGFDLGVYEVRVIADSGPQLVAIVEDRFVLR